jgi:hypothetical protein
MIVLRCVASRPPWTHLTEPRTEREQLIEAIAVLEGLAVGRSKRRGRPPAWMTAIKRARQAAGEQEQAEGRVSALEPVLLEDRPRFGARPRPMPLKVALFCNTLS